MSEHHSTRGNAPKAGAPHAAQKLTCEEWEVLLVDFLDGSLPANEVGAFESHKESCASCAATFGHANQGREWLNFLRVEPQVSPALVAKILAQTSGAAAVTSPLGGAAVTVSPAVIPVAAATPFWKRPGMSLAAQRAVEPRMMMTAAMAFFSITLTLNIAGVRLGTVRLADLKPAALSSNLNKQYHMASARVVRYYDNLRFVYEMEARVKELRRDADLDTTAPSEKPEQPAATPPVDGNHKSGGKSQGPGTPPPQAMLWGERIEATLHAPPPLSASHLLRYDNSAPSNGSDQSPAGHLSADQAERGNA